MKGLIITYLSKIKVYKNYLPIFIFFAFLGKSLLDAQFQDYFYGDDTWLLLGARVDSYIDSLRCCAVSHPFFSLFAQSIFKITGYSTLISMIIYIVVSNALALITYILPNRFLSFNEKILTHILIISAPMFIHYSIRAKPYIFDAAISIIVIFVYFKITKSPNKNYFILLSLLLLISVASWPLIGAVLFITFINVLKNKDFELFKNMLYFIPGVLVSGIQIFRWHDSGMQNFVISYYAPTEGGLSLFFRWIYFSFIRYFGPSNKLDLGFFNLPLSVAILFFLLGLAVIYKKNYDFFILYSLAMGINLIASILKIWPFGGFRSSIYLLPLFCIIFSKGLISTFDAVNKLNISFVMTLTFSFIMFFNMESPNYEQTTRSFDNQEFINILQNFDKTDDDILIYHGGLQTFALYSERNFNLEDLGYFETGSGTEGFHIPEFTDSNINVACTFYTGRDNGQSCYLQNVEFLNSFKNSKITLVGVHIRDHQFQAYLDAFDDLGWNFDKNYFYDNEVASITFTK